MNNYPLPEVGLRGSFILSPPYAAQVKLGANSERLIYEVMAVRRLEDLQSKNEDPTKTIEVYTNNQTKYMQDLVDGVSIVTLMTPNQPIIHVPTSYIVSIPTNDQVPYSKFVLSVLVGELPDDFSTTALKEEMRAVVLRMVGTQAIVKEGRLPYNAVISNTDHQARLTARNNAMLTAPPTLEVSNDTLQANLDKAKTHIDALLARLATLETA